MLDIISLPLIFSNCLLFIISGIPATLCKKKEEKKRHIVFARRKLKPTGTIILQIQQSSHVINID